MVACANGPAGDAVLQGSAAPTAVLRVPPALRKWVKPKQQQKREVDLPREASADGVLSPLMLSPKAATGNTHGSCSVSASSSECPSMHQTAPCASSPPPWAASPPLLSPGRFAPLPTESGAAAESRRTRHAQALLRRASELRGSFGSAPPADSPPPPECTSPPEPPSELLRHWVRSRTARSPVDQGMAASLAGAKSRPACREGSTASRGRAPEERSCATATPTSGTKSCMRRSRSATVGEVRVRFDPSLGDTEAPRKRCPARRRSSSQGSRLFEGLTRCVIAAAYLQGALD
eukprot:TRINITY_DN60047_c0_g1_i1.p1 TRINITY_DN60047_c0_g1~~TRINITY_DN60047_c0_g1_i1.p1  ORF type:complete len:324 (+),score=70.66 TRINITY_DN60047_c0_g1_i1:100-972(+)